MQYTKKVIAKILSLCLILSLLAGVQVPESVQAADDPIRVTCVGDSITAGYKSTNGQSYPTQMQDILGKGYAVTNVGVSGRTVIRSDNNAYSKTDKYTKGLQSKPDIVIIMIGTNDSVKFNLKTENTELKKTFRDDYAALIEDYQKCGTNPKIILGLPTTSVSEKNVEDDRDQKNEAFTIPIITELAEKYGLQLLDTHTYTGSWIRESAGKGNNHLADGLHPNNAGYGRLAKFFANAIIGYTQKITGDIQKNTDYAIVSKSSDMAMTIEGYSEENGAGLCQMPTGNYASQIWNLIPCDDGCYQIVNKHSGKVLDVPRSSTQKDTQIEQYTKGNGDNQRWKLEAVGDGSWRITPKLAQELALNVSGNSKENGGVIIQWPYGGAKNEHWQLVKVDKVVENPKVEKSIRVTCVGDSITEGYKSTNGQSYPTQMQDILGNGYTVTNVGVSGTTVIRSYDNAYSKTDKYKKGLQSKPDIVIIMLGTNDSVKFNLKTENTDLKKTFRDDYAALIEDYQKCGTNPKIILGLPTTSVSEKNVEDDRDQKNEAFTIPIITELAEKYGLQLLDTHTYTGSWIRESAGSGNNHLADGLHPNNAGYGRLAKFFANAIIGYTQKITGDIQKNTDYAIVSKSSDMAMTIEGCSEENGAGLCQMPTENYASQIWNLIPCDDGCYQIVNKHSGKVLDVPKSSTQQKIQIQQNVKGNGDNQRWKFEAVGDGSWRITPKLAQGLALNVSGNSKKKGDSIIQMSYGGAKNEHWQLVKVDKVVENPQPEEMTSVGFEMEVGDRNDGAKLIAAEACSNGYYVANDGDEGAAVTFTINALQEGTRTLKVYYAAKSKTVLEVKVNDVVKEVELSANGSDSEPGENPVTVQIELKEGNNTIRFGGVQGDDAANLDRFELELTETETQNILIDLINDIPDKITASDADKAYIRAIQITYNALKQEVQKGVSNVEFLEKANHTLEEAIKEAETDDPDKEEPGQDDPDKEEPGQDTPNTGGENNGSNTPNPGEGESNNPKPEEKDPIRAVMNYISSIGIVTLDSGDAIQKARDAYEALTEEEQKLVSNYMILQAAEEKYAQLNAENQNSQQEKKDKAAAQLVSDEIAAIGTVNLNSKAQIDAARKAYDSLTKTQQGYVSNYQILLDAESQYEALKKAETDKQAPTNSSQSNAKEDGKTTEQAVKVSKITITGISKNIAVGKKIKLVASVKPANADNKFLTWKSSNTRFAKVDQKGRVTIQKAAKNKTVTITATARDGSGTKAKYKIKCMPQAVEKIQIAAKSKTVTAGQKLSLKAVVAPNSKKVNKNVTWKSSKEEYATVSKNGVVRTKKAGKGEKVKITAVATDGSNCRASVTITIK